jgi:hypothetical protein
MPLKNPNYTELCNLEGTILSPADTVMTEAENHHQFTGRSTGAEISGGYVCVVSETHGSAASHQLLSHTPVNCLKKVCNRYISNVLIYTEHS